jgi:hypothetical protein
MLSSSVVQSEVERVCAYAANAAVWGARTTLALPAASREFPVHLKKFNLHPVDTASLRPLLRINLYFDLLCSPFYAPQSQNITACRPP